MSASEIDTTRDRLLDAAGEIFAAKGFDAATVRDICNSAGANVAAVNYYFGDKHRLYIEAVVRAHRWRMEQVAMPAWRDETPAEEKLADFIATFVRRIRSGPDDTWHTRLLMREMMHPDAACAEMARSSIRPEFEILHAILRELALEETSEESLHLVGFSIVGQCLFYYFADKVIRNLIDESEYAEYDVEKLSKHIVDFSLAAIRDGVSFRADAKAIAKR